MSKPGEVKSLYSSAQAEDDANRPKIDNMGEVDRFSTTDLDRLKIVYSGMPNNKVLNIFRELRTQLLKKSDKNFVCMVSSICAGGGASFMATNLAAVFALDKSKTSMLIDANLYAPSLESLVVGETSVGITDFLHGVDLRINDIVYATGVPRLRVIPIGSYSEGAAEYFSSAKMEAFITEVRSRYPDRYIFIDAPPVANSSEARILADIADMVVLVVPHGRATPEQLETAVNIVGKQKLSGLVYNN